MPMTNSRTKIDRLRKRREFLAASHAVKWAAPGLVLQARPRGDEEAPRVGFTVTKKVGIAVTRNRARRRLKEAAREILPVHAKAGYDYVLVGRVATLTRAWPDLLDDLGSALRHVHAGGQTKPRGARPASGAKPRTTSTESKDKSFHG